MSLSHPPLSAFTLCEAESQKDARPAAEDARSFAQDDKDYAPLDQLYR